MILTCPSCSTQYVVKDGAIPPQGRQVRCAACKHSWHQDPDPVERADSTAAGTAPAIDAGFADPAPGEIPPPPQEQWSVPAEPEAPPPAEPSAEPSAEPGAELAIGQESPAGRADYGSLDDNRSFAEIDTDPGRSDPAEAADADTESLAEAALIEPRTGPEAEERAYEEALVADSANQPVEDGWRPPARPGDALAAEPAPAGEALEPSAAGPAADEDFSPFAEDGEERRRRPLLALLAIALLIVALAALFWFAAPAAWKARVGLAAGGASPLALVMTHMDRQKLESGNELLTVTGRVINPTSEVQAVPPLQAQLKSASGQLVYSWTIAPPAQRLAPGASASFNSAEVNVPPGGDAITLTLGQAKS